MTTLPQNTPMRTARPGASVLAIPGAAPIHAAPVPSFAMNGGDVLRVLRANSWLIALLVVVGAGIGFVANTYLLKYFPRYTSIAYVRVMSDAEIPRPGELFAEGGGGGTVDLEVREQMTKLQHGALAARVLDNSAAIRQTRWFQQFVHTVDGKPTVDVEAAKLNLLENLDVSPVTGTRLLAVSFSCASPTDCQTILTELIEQHMADQRQLRQDQEAEQGRTLARMKLTDEANLAEIQSRLQHIVDQLNQEGQPLQGRGLREVQYETFSSEQMKLQAALENAEAELKKLKDDLTTTGTSPPIEEMISSNSEYIEYQKQVEETSMKLVETRESLGDSNPQVEQLGKMLATFEKNAVALHNRLKEVAVTHALSSLTDAVKNLTAASDANRVRVDQAQQQMAEIASQINDYQTIKLEAHDAQDKIDKLKDTADSFDNWNVNGEFSNVSWAAKPELPDIPTFPKLVNTLSMAIGLGLALGLGIAFLREMTDNSVRSPRDIARVGQMNLLGLIPHQDDDPQAVGARLPLLIMDAPHSMIAEQFRQVRTRLQHAASLDTTRSILITGCSPGDGKTTIACNLAAGLALNGRRILLVDANFRRPQLHQIFDLENHLGFGDVLTKPEAFAEAVKPTTVPNLDVLVLGNKPTNSTELLESQLLIDFIERALQEYDHVLFDSGPLLIVSETVGMAPRVDGVVTVVRAQGNSRGILQRLRDQLRQIKAEHLGVILNAVRTHGGGYYGPLIKTYYAYQNGGIHTNGSAHSNGNGSNGSNGSNGVNGHD
jgi:capsular exopolysaccharide synthesis family protein